MEEAQVSVLQAFRMAILQESWFDERVAITKIFPISGWLVGHGGAGFPMIKALGQWSREATRTQVDFLIKLEEIIGDAPVSLMAYRIFLGMCYNVANRFPLLRDTDLREYVELYCLSLDTGTRFLEDRPAELHFLQTYFSEELLAARAESHRLAMHRRHFLEILPGFKTFLWFFDLMNPSHFYQWESMSKKVQERMDLLVDHGRKNGNLFDHPENVWRKVNNARPSGR
jgi:hypothetical protein